MRFVSAGNANGRDATTDRRVQRRSCGDESSCGIAPRCSGKVGRNHRHARASYIADLQRVNLLIQTTPPNAPPPLYAADMLVWGLAYTPGCPVVTSSVVRFCIFLLTYSTCCSQRPCPGFDGSSDGVIPPSMESTGSDSASLDISACSGELLLHSKQCTFDACKVLQVSLVHCCLSRAVRGCECARTPNYGHLHSYVRKTPMREHYWHTPHIQQSTSSRGPWYADTASDRE